jgi:hypothetical protein
MIPQQLQGFDISGIASENPFQECDFDFQCSRLSGRHSFSGTALSRHTTRWIVSKLGSQVKRESASAGDGA